LYKIAQQPKQSLLYFQRALTCRPDFAEAWYNSGVILSGLPDSFEEACNAYRTAIALKPDYADAYNNLGFALSCLGHADIAEKSLVAALILAPQRPETLNNLGMACQNQGRLDDALACYQSALTLNPDFAQAHNNRGMALLAAGRFEEGWREREWRWRTPHLASSYTPYPVPQWRGEPADGQRILIHAEQGLGDSLQFGRYLPLVAARGLRISLLIPRPLRRLFARMAGIERILTEDEPPSPYDLHCPMMSLPLAFSTTLANIPANIPYFFATSDSAALWNLRLAGSDDRCRVGLAWAGSARPEFPDLAALDRRRSIPPDNLAPIWECPDTTFFSLQKNGPLPSSGAPIIDHMAEIDDFADTAALIANLDLVISVDTAVAHLAGALGKPVWLLNRFDGCWRWRHHGDDSPWYPTLRQFRQPRPGNWNSVIASVARSLTMERHHLTQWRKTNPSSRG
jgi:Tfp pilus assembly protein PilF